MTRQVENLAGRTNERAWSGPETENPLGHLLDFEAFGWLRDEALTDQLSGSPEVLVILVGAADQYYWYTELLAKLDDRQAVAVWSHVEPGENQIGPPVVPYQIHNYIARKIRSARDVYLGPIETPVEVSRQKITNKFFIIYDH